MDTNLDDLFKDNVDRNKVNKNLAWVASSYRNTCSNHTERHITCLKLIYDNCSHLQVNDVFDLDIDIEVTVEGIQLKWLDIKTIQQPLSESDIQFLETQTGKTWKTGWLNGKVHN